MYEETRMLQERNRNHQNQYVDLFDSIPNANNNFQAMIFFWNIDRYLRVCLLKGFVGLL